MGLDERGPPGSSPAAALAILSLGPWGQVALPSARGPASARRREILHGRASVRLPGEQHLAL